MSSTDALRQFRYLAIAALVGLACFTFVLVSPRAWWSAPPAASQARQDIQAPAVSLSTFDGESARLAQTMIVPTLDTPIPDGKSVIWCSAFVFAWREMIKEVVKEPIQVQNAEIVAQRLNEAKESQEDVAPGTSYAAAGRIRETLDKIKTDMTRLFPNVRLPSLLKEEEDRVLVAYAYLQANVKFKHLFIDNDQPLTFTDSRGKRTAVHTFGIRPEDTNRDPYLTSFRGQVRILWQDHEKDEFAIDLCAESAPNQIVVAKLPRQATLSKTLTDLLAKTHHLQTSQGSKLHVEDSLLVPNQQWSIQHHFLELEGHDKLLLNPSLRGLYVGTAYQDIQFKLDRTGAELASNAVVFFNNGGPQRYHFDKPFLIVMKKRDAERPFFVMWVDNAELLSKM